MSPAIPTRSASGRARWLYAAILLMAIAAFIATLLWFRDEAHPALVLPGKGDEAVISVRVAGPRALARSGYWSQSDFRRLKFTLRCVAAEGLCRDFELKWLQGGKPGRLVCRIAADFSGEHLSRRTSAFLPSGRRLRRGELVAGIPAPFPEFLLFPRDYLPRGQHRTQRLPNHQVALLQLGRWPGGWQTILDLGLEDGHETAYRQEQYWRSGDWVWYKAVYKGKRLWVFAEAAARMADPHAVRESEDPL